MSRHRGKFNCACEPAPAEYHWFLCALAPRQDGSGRFSGSVGYLADISGFKKTTESFFRTETRYRQLFDSNLICAMYTSVEGEILEANHKFLEMVGYSANDIKAGRLRWIDLTPPEYKAQAEANARELRVKGIFQPIEKEYIRKDGSRVPVLVTSALLEGSTTEAITFVVDITEHKRTEQATRQHAESLANGQIAALNRTLTLLATEPSLDTALSHVLKAISEQLSVTSSGLHLAGLHANDTLLHMNYDDGQITRGEDIDDPSALQPLHVARATKRWQAQKGGCREPVVLDVSTSPEFDEDRRAQLLANNVCTLLLVPLLVHNKLVGTLSIRIKERRELRRAEIERRKPSLNRPVSPFISRILPSALSKWQFSRSETSPQPGGPPSSLAPTRLSSKRSMFWLQIRKSTKSWGTS